MSRVRGSESHARGGALLEANGEAPGLPVVAEAESPTGSPLERLRAVILLAGSVRASAWRRAVGRFLLELPIDRQHTVMDCWHGQFSDLAQRLGVERLPVRVIVDRSTPMPASNRWNGTCEVRFEQDPFEYRGTGGLLSDLARQYEDDDVLLVVHAAQVLFDPLSGVVEALGEAAADVTLASERDGSPSGLMLVRCGSFRAVPKVGFVDLNEQALPAIAQGHEVRVATLPRPAGMPIRTLAGYVEAVRAYHRRTNGASHLADPYAEDWQASFRLIEEGANVDETATVHDSVVLAGARVEPGALLVRAVVCPGATVHRGRSAIDRLVAPPMAPGV